MCKTAVYNSDWSPAYTALLRTQVFGPVGPNSFLYCPYHIVFLFPGSSVH